MSYAKTMNTLQIIKPKADQTSYANNTIATLGFSSGEKQASSQLASEFKITQNTGNNWNLGHPPQFSDEQSFEQFQFTVHCFEINTGELPENNHIYAKNGNTNWVIFHFWVMIFFPTEWWFSSIYQFENNNNPSQRPKTHSILKRPHHIL